jgi:hypothetical protein
VSEGSSRLKHGQPRPTPPTSARPPTHPPDKRPGWRLGTAACCPPAAAPPSQQAGEVACAEAPALQSWAVRVGPVQIQLPEAQVGQLRLEPRLPAHLLRRLGQLVAPKEPAGRVDPEEHGLRATFTRQFGVGLPGKTVGGRNPISQR